MGNVDIQIADKVDSNIWNESIKGSPYGTIYQTTYYADYAKTILGWKPIYITAKVEKEIGQLLLFLAPRFERIFHERKLAHNLCNVFSRIRPVAHWFFGPVTSGNAILYLSLLKTATNFIKKRMGVVAEALPHPLDDKEPLFIKANFTPEKRGAFIIDLKQNIPTLWGSLEKKSARKNIERAIERGVTITTAETYKDIEGYHRVLTETRVRDGLKSSSLMDIYTFWKMLRNEKSMECFVAKYEGRVMAGLFVSTFNGYLNEWGAAVSTDAIKDRLYASELLRWHVIKWGHEQGFRYYDMTGVNPNPTSDKESGIFRFKQKFGGKLILYNHYRLLRS